MTTPTQYNVFGEATEVDLGSGDKDVYTYDAALGRVRQQHDNGSGRRHGAGLRSRLRPGHEPHQWRETLHGEVDGMPVGISVPEAVPFGFGPSGSAGCDFGACVGGDGFDSDLETAIESLWKVFLDHLDKIEGGHDGAPVLGTWARHAGRATGNIMKQARRPTKGRRSGSVRDYLERLGIDWDKLDEYLPSPTITVNPCLLNPSLPGCGQFPGAPPIA